MKIGGSLTYSTCSPLREEGEGTVAAFLKREAGREFRCEEIQLGDAVLEPYICDAEVYIYIYIYIYTQTYVYMQI